MIPIIITISTMLSSHLALNIANSINASFENTNLLNVIHILESNLNTM